MNKMQPLGLVLSLIGWMFLGYSFTVQESLYCPHFWWVWVLISVGYVFIVIGDFRNAR